MLLSGCEVHGAGLAEPFGRRSLEKAPPDSLPEDRARWNCGFCIPPKLSKRLAWSTFCGCMFLRVSLKLIPETQAEGKGVVVITALATCAQVVRLDRLWRLDICDLRFPGEGEIIFQPGIKITCLESYSVTTYFSDAQQFQAPWPHAFKPVPPKLWERHREYWRIREHSGPWALFCCFSSPPDKDSIVPALRIKSDMKMLETFDQLVKREPWLQTRWMHSPLFSKSHDSRFRIRRSCSCCVGGDGFPTTAQIGTRWGHPNGASKIWILLKLFSFAGLRRVRRWMRMITTYLHILHRVIPAMPWHSF